MSVFSVNIHDLGQHFRKPTQFMLKQFYSWSASVKDLDLQKTNIKRNRNKIYWAKKKILLNQF